MKRIVILGTGGTIAGQAASARQHVQYRAASIAVADLAAGTQMPSGLDIETEQVAQVDSKDMSVDIWRALATRAAHHLARPEVAGIVVTHGTDTMEETAWFLHRVLAPARPVVLTAAMRPATALAADGPQNLLDAVSVAALPEARGVLACVAGVVHAGRDLRKVHPYRMDAFDSGDAGPLGFVEDGRLRRLREWPDGEPFGLDAMLRADWPRVDIVMNTVGADGVLVDALRALGVRGIVAACTGNGTLSRSLEEALLRAQEAGVAVLRATRIGRGALVEAEGATSALPSAGALTPVQARVELMLRLLQQDMTD